LIKDPCKYGIDQHNLTIAARIEFAPGSPRVDSQLNLTFVVAHTPYYQYVEDRLYAPRDCDLGYCFGFSHVLPVGYGVINTTEEFLSLLGGKEMITGKSLRSGERLILEIVFNESSWHEATLLSFAANVCPTELESSFPSHSFFRASISRLQTWQWVLVDSATPDSSFGVKDSVFWLQTRFTVGKPRWNVLSWRCTFPHSSHISRSLNR
jgi:hypothetical protein